MPQADRLRRRRSDEIQDHRETDANARFDDMRALGAFGDGAGGWR